VANPQGIRKARIKTIKSTGAPGELKVEAVRPVTEFACLAYTSATL